MKLVSSNYKQWPRTRYVLFIIMLSLHAVGISYFFVKTGYHVALVLYNYVTRWQFKDFTTDPVNFPTKKMSQFIDEVHSNGQHYVIIVDPAIALIKGYKPYEDGLQMDIFIKDYLKKVFIGKVWPGETVYPDFSYNLTTEYWTNQIEAFIEQLAVDGLWIDMNEPSNFCNGACYNRVYKNHEVSSEFDPIYPPYTIGNRKHPNGVNSSPLRTKTLDMDALHHSGVTAYNMHNLYGFTESIATRQALMSVYKGKRPFVLSRSTFSGSGVYAAHWLGDNTASADDLYYSIPTILSFQLFGVPLVGGDICGFEGDTTEELCARWMELGAFYPFSRNHNNDGSSSQEPYLWESVAAISRKYLGIRYSLLPYYYTLFFEANHSPSDNVFHPTPGVVLQPLFFPFSTDSIARGIDNQFLVGSALLICPQYRLGDQGEILDVYLPAAVWYDWYTHKQLTTGSESTLFENISTPLDFMPMYIRGGHIIPMQGPGLTTTESRKNPYSLLVALHHGSAEGSIYLDDGETYNTTEYTFVSYECSNAGLRSYVRGTKYATKAGLPTLLNVTILGVFNKPTVVVLDGVPLDFTFTNFNLMVDQLSINMDSIFYLKWM